jgi:hypothetical protein
MVRASRHHKSKSMPARILQQKDTNSSCHSPKDLSVSGSGNAVTSGTRRPLKISLIFDEVVSARTAENSLKRIASNFEYNIQSFAFHELNPPEPGVTAARIVSDTDILMVAVRDHRALPNHMRFWLGLCLSLRQGNQEGLLVALIMNAAGSADPDSSLFDYLKALAAIGGMAFLLHQTGHNRVSISNDASPAQRHLPGPN